MADDEEEIAFEEIHFCAIASQTNVYGLTKVESDEEGNKIFLASLSGRVMCLEYQQNFLVPSAREVPFTYIPGSPFSISLLASFGLPRHEIVNNSAEIVSIDAFMRPEPSKRLVVGISLILLKNSRSQQKQFLNIYSALESKAEFSLDSIAEGCQHLELDFVPFQLTHAEIFVRGRQEVVFLLCGSDECVHMFCEDRTQQRFEEQPVGDYFPELQHLPSNVLWLEVQTQLTRRITVLGCQDGHVKLAVTALIAQPSVIKEYSLNRDGPISSVKLFSLNCKQPQKIREDDIDVDKSEGVSSSDLHLLVCCAIETSVVFMYELMAGPLLLRGDIINQGFTNMVTLPESDDFDSVTCASIADVDWDGCDEIVMGTYGQELLVYKCVFTDGITTPANNVDFQLICRRSFASPLFAIEYLDLTKDGLKELAVASLSGLHVLQRNVNQAAKKFLPKLKQTSNEYIEDTPSVT